VNREPDNDALDQALRSRRAIAPPSRFTAQVLARVKSEAQLSPVEDFVATYGVQAGIAAALVGVRLTVDVNTIATKMIDALQTPNAAAVTGIVAICLAWALMRQEPEGGAL
jgi:hypothetical protein